MGAIRFGSYTSTVDHLNVTACLLGEAWVFMMLPGVNNMRLPKHVSTLSYLRGALNAAVPPTLSWDLPPSATAYYPIFPLENFQIPCPTPPPPQAKHSLVHWGFWLNIQKAFPKKDGQNLPLPALLNLLVSRVSSVPWWQHPWPSKYFLEFSEHFPHLSSTKTCPPSSLQITSDLLGSSLCPWPFLWWKILVDFKLPPCSHSFPVV